MTDVSAREKRTDVKDSAPKDVKTAFQHYLEQEYKYSESITDRCQFERSKQEDWSKMIAKRRAHFVRAAMQDQARFQEELDKYLEFHPDFKWTSFSRKEILFNERLLWNAERNVKLPSIDRNCIAFSDEWQHFYRKMKNVLKETEPTEVRNEIEQILWRILPTEYHQEFSKISKSRKPKN